MPLSYCSAKRSSATLNDRVQLTALSLARLTILTLRLYVGELPLWFVAQRLRRLVKPVGILLGRYCFQFHDGIDMGSCAGVGQRRCPVGIDSLDCNTHDSAFPRWSCIQTVPPEGLRQPYRCTAFAASHPLPSLKELRITIQLQYIDDIARHPITTDHDHPSCKVVGRHFSRYDVVGCHCV
jgi:hypothetical protein